MDNMFKWLQLFVLTTNVLSILYSVTVKKDFDELNEKRNEVEKLKMESEKEFFEQITKSISTMAELTMLNSQIIIDSWNIIRSSNEEIIVDDARVEEVNALVRDLKRKVYGSGGR